MYLQISSKTTAIAQNSKQDLTFNMLKSSSSFSKGKKEKKTNLISWKQTSPSIKSDQENTKFS